MSTAPESASAPPLHLSQQLCFALYAATHAMTRAYRSPLAGLGVTYPQYLVLLVLWETDQVPVGEIAKRLQLDAAALTPLVKRLEALNLIVRVRDQRDERVVRISLTEKAKSLRSEAEKVQQDVACMTGFKDEEVRHLRQQLQALVLTLEKNASEA